MEESDLLFVQETGRGPTHGRTRSQIRAHVMDRVVAGRRTELAGRLNYGRMPHSFQRANSDHIVDSDPVEKSVY